MDQRLRQYYEQIDKVALDCGHTSEDIEAITGSSSQRDRFNLEIAPEVFMKLIELGYREAELTL